jgi:glycosyltransferase involved in cell wall biosynthesis
MEYVDMQQLIKDDKKTILVFLSCYVPGYRGGGPTRTIFNMISYLGHEFNFKIITNDRDLGDDQPYTSIRRDEWNAIGLAEVYYVSKSTSIFKISDLINQTPYDILYLNSFFGLDFTLKPLLLHWTGLIEKKPIILAPRGEFSKAALSLKKWKKISFLLLARYTGLYRSVSWHASTQYEESDIKVGLLDYLKIDYSSVKIHVARNLSVYDEDIALGRSSSEPKDGLSICFLSRIVSIKNLDFALEILAKMTIPIRFDIYGPKESDEYWAMCQSIIDRMPKNVTIRYCGAVRNEEVRKIISAYDLFFVPTKGENFGHVFAEALSVGVPILLSDQTPWRDLVNLRVGWDLSLDDPDAFLQAISAYAASSASQRHDYRQSCLRFYRQRCLDHAVLNANRQLFLQF